jgi:hypothetical protein
MPEFDRQRRTIPKIRRCVLAITLLASLAAPTAARADIIPIGPFTGAVSENFANTGVDGATQTLTVFGGLATIQNTTAGGALKVERSSSLGGNQQVPRSPPWMVGQLGVALWTFSEPLSDFGGYFPNNSRFNDATVQFYGTSGALLGTLTATVPDTPLTWTWNGWHSDTPIGSLIITGNDVGFLNGFIWYDDFTLNPASSVPEPASMTLLATAGLGALPWAWRSRRWHRGKDKEATT